MYWISENSSFYDIINETNNIKISWSKNIFNDQLNLSRYYFDSAYEICKEILDDNINDNVKYDMWFLPCVYLFRQSIELLIKAGLSKTIRFKPKLQSEFIKSKHNLKLLFDSYTNNVEQIQLSNEELFWIKKYLESIENIDANSDLFRYPFKDDFLSQYKNDFLDIVSMANRLIQCYSILNKSIFGHKYEDEEIDLTYIPEFLSFATHGFGNCYLWDSPWGDGFHKQVIGYSETGKYLFEKFKQCKKVAYVYPMIFLFRNAIELALKRLMYVQAKHQISEYQINKIKNTHLLYKDLWSSIKPVLGYYAEKSGQDIHQIEIAEKYIDEINLIDKNGDMFRYPFSYSFEYKFNNKLINIENVYIYFQSIFNFLNGCDNWLDEISDFEREMYSYYDCY